MGIGFTDWDAAIGVGFAAVAGCGAAGRAGTPITGLRTGILSIGLRANGSIKLMNISIAQQW